MRLSKIIKDVKNIIASEKEIDVDRIDISDSLNEFEIDSLDKVNIINSIEDIFKINIPDEKFWSAKYVDDIVVLVLESIPD